MNEVKLTRDHLPSFSDSDLRMQRLAAGYYREDRPTTFMGRPAVAEVTVSRAQPGAWIWNYSIPTEHIWDRGGYAWFPRKKDALDDLNRSFCGEAS